MGIQWRVPKCNSGLWSPIKTKFLVDPITGLSANTQKLILCVKRIKKHGKRCIPICQTYKTTIIQNQFFLKVDQHTEGKWLIRDTKHDKNNQLQSMELPCGAS